MRDSVLRLYHRLPAPARSIAASLRGLYLRSWRYGPETEGLVEAALERDAWSESEWRDWREQRLSRLLHRAATRVPYYRDVWAKRRAREDRASWQYLENWPILTKETVRENAPNLVADDCNVRRMYHEQTSGTTGKPLNLWRSRRTERAWFALFEARVRRWNGITRADRWAMLGGQLVVPVARRKPPFWVWNAGMKQLYMSSYHLSPDTIPDYLDAMRRYDVTYVLAYASSMTTVAQASLERGIPAPALCVAISNAEPLSDSQRGRISSAFRCPVRDTYGMAEIVCGASECASGSLHLWPEAGILEILQDDRDEAAPQGATGRVVCTGLLNADMPLVRYEVGDRGVVGSAEALCACGRLLPRLGQIEGRADDLVVTPDGRRIGRLDPVFKADLPIREAQIVQEAVDRVRVRLVPAPGYGPSHARSVRHRLGQRLGDAVHVVVETVTEIPRGPGGKFRAVVSLLDRAETERATARPTPAAGA